MQLKHFTSCDTLSDEDVYGLIHRACDLKAGNVSPIQSNLTAVNCFFENSTRTQTSFEMAQRKCGMSVIPFNASTSSISKGESLFDTLLTMDAIGVDIAVVRCSEEGFFHEIMNCPTMNISIINAGDGAGEHPTQCMLDMMTIYEEFNTFKDLNVVIVGDVKHSRVAHSNARLLTRLGANVSFFGPPQFMDETMDQYGPVVDLKSVIQTVDVVMLLRVQNERHSDVYIEDYHNHYGLTQELAKKLKASAIIMHPAPVNRGVEIDSDLVISQHSRIVDQMRNGVYTRIAILEAITKGRTQ